MDSINVLIDDRVRLMSAMLAVTSWPADEQYRKPHGTHAHARAGARFLAGMDKHPAVLILQALLDRQLPLSELYGYILRLSWPSLWGEHPPSWAPPTWARHMLDFYEKSGLETWWQEESAVWNKSLEQLSGIFEGVRFDRFMQPFVGSFHEALICVPNVGYPTDQAVGVSVNGEIFCIIPPRMAWGDNPPWPFDEDAAYLYQMAVTQFAQCLMYRYMAQYPSEMAAITRRKLPVSGISLGDSSAWEDQFMTLFTSGLVAIYLEDAVSKQEAEAYVLMEKKANGVDWLPGVVSVLRRYMRGHEAGEYASFVDYLPHFGKHLRVARTITSL